MEGQEGTERAADLFKALSNPLRVAIVDELARGPRCVHDLVDLLGVQQPLVSQHLRVLRSARLVAAERRGRESAYVLEDDHVAHIVADGIKHANERNPR
jgi:ArsR family transcriptional regulator, zinc-responsive transcriptional repressor